jgi:hypothetical protein
MPVESVDDHPTYDFGGNTVTSLIAPSRGGVECVLYNLRQATVFPRIVTITSIRSRSLPVGVFGTSMSRPSN